MATRVTDGTRRERHENTNIIMLAVHFGKLVETSMLVVTINAKTSDSTIYQSQEQDSLHCTTS